jgi:hypothetical protein
MSTSVAEGRSMALMECRCFTWNMHGIDFGVGADFSLSEGSEPALLLWPSA